MVQVLQGIAAALQPAEDVLEPDADPTCATGPEDDTAEALSQIIDILKQLQGAVPDVGHPGATAARLSELCDQLQGVAAGAPSAGLPGRVHQLLQELREHLSGMDWGRMIKTTAAEPPAAVSRTEEEASSGKPTPPARSDVSDGVHDFPENGLPEVVRKFRAEAGPIARGPGAMATESRAVSTPGPASAPEDVKTQDVGREPLVRLPSVPAVPASQAGEGGRGWETPRPGIEITDSSGSPTGVRENQGAVAEGERQPADSRLFAKMFSGADAAKPENAEPAEPFDLGTAGQRPLHLHEGGLEKTAEMAEAGKEKQAAATGRAGVFDQIVQRAVVQLKTDQSEIRIDLKPDFLGHVRMRIVTENQQVSVRILTELPAVRDMIETGLQQLRSELQNQGLHVDRLEVAVSDDPRQPPRRQGRPDELPKPGGSGTIAGADGLVSKDRSDAIYYQRRAGGTATIDMFV
jgi:hypothetical protein